MSVWPELPIEPGPILRVFGMRRSGNHAIINWIARNAPDGRSVFFNNCPVGTDPMIRHRGVEVNGERVVLPQNVTVKMTRRAGDGALVVVSYEDVMPGGARRKNITAGVAPGAITHNVIIARDFLNWSASLFRKLKSNRGYGSSQRMSVLLRAFEGYSKMLDLVLEKDAPARVVIQYGDWFSDPDYRLGIMSRLGLPDVDNTVGQVQPYGGGSSFDGDTTDATQLTPLNRWQDSLDDPDYQILLWLAARDPDLHDKITQAYPNIAAPLRDITQRIDRALTIDTVPDMSRLTVAATTAHPLRRI